MMLLLLPPPLTIMLLLALVSPIAKDSSTSLYSITLGPNDGGSFVIDLSSPFSWRRCDPRDPLLPCASLQCLAARRQQPDPESCPHPSWLQIDGENDSSSGHQDSECTVTASNSVAESIVVSFSPVWIFRNGEPLTRFVLPPLTIQERYWSHGGQQAVRNLLAEQFFIPGVSFFRNGPFYLLPPPGTDVTKFLSFTTLLKNPMMTNNLDYYIDVRSICINGEPAVLTVACSSLKTLGYGGVKVA
ncbi:hypothetical protein NL676_023314 [Syzygium grande]|nr:hypothetical protein NL676_023314 [Syzygium grande]